MGKNSLNMVYGQRELSQGILSPAGTRLFGKEPSRRFVCIDCANAGMNLCSSQRRLAIASRQEKI